MVRVDDGGPVGAARHGFTLIELLFCLVLAIVIALVAVPLTKGWVDGVRQVQVRGDLLEAIGRAKSIALRNGSATTSETQLAAIRLNGDRVTVEDLIASAVIWEARVPDAVELVEPGGSSFACAAYNSRGLLTLGAECGQAPTHIVARITGQESVDVELL